MRAAYGAVFRHARGFASAPVLQVPWLQLLEI